MSKEILYDHYKETCAKNGEAQAHRNKFFLLSLVCIAGLAGFTVLPDILVQAVLSWLQVNASADMNTLAATFQSLVWVFLTYALIRYVQASVQVERNYPCMYKLEKELGFTRESDDYLSSYPVVLNFVDFFYKKFYPLATIIFVFTKTVLEWTSLSCSAVYCVINSALAMFIIALMVLYMAFLYKVARYYNSRKDSGDSSTKSAGRFH